MRKQMWEITKHKNGRRHYGWFCKNTATGMVVYVARRFHKEIFRSGEKTISDAQRKNVACWAIDVETLRMCKIKGAKYVAVWLRENGSLFLAPIERFDDPVNVKTYNFSHRGGALQRYLPLTQFRQKLKVKI
jgi:hypothetical protein